MKRESVMKSKETKLNSAVANLIRVLEEYDDFEDYLNRLELVAKKLTQNQEFHKSLYNELKLEELNNLLDEVASRTNPLN
jgi:hypothetical protein